MKKYIKPNTEIFEVELQAMMSGSTTPESVNQDETPQEYGSRQGRGYWDDEEEY